MYSVYLDDRLAAYKTIRYDPEAHNAVNPAGFCRLDTLPANELLDKLPVVSAVSTEGIGNVLGAACSSSYS